MNSEKMDLARQVTIARHHWDVPVRVGLRPYVEFSRRMECELGKLVDKWIHAAAPGAMGLWRNRNTK